MPPHTPGLNGRIANDLLHDFAAGFFPGAVTAAWLIQRALEAADPGRGAVVAHAAGALWLVMAAALTVSVVTGLVRLRYWRLNVRSGFLESKGQMAATKHILFALLLLASAFLLATL